MKEELEVVLRLKKLYPRISEEQISLISVLALNTDGFRVVCEAEMFQHGRRYTEIAFKYSTKRYKGNLKIEIER